MRWPTLFLDTYFCNAHTTASDALWAGLPVITCPRDTFATRVCASLLHTLGLPELICDSLDTYRTLALDFAHTPKKLTALKHRLTTLRHASPLFNTEAFCAGHGMLTETTLGRKQKSTLRPRRCHINLETAVDRLVDGIVG